MKILKEIKAELSSLDKGQKSSLFKICATLSLLYFSYPMIRATSEAIFLEVYKAKSSPLVWVYSVITLSISILIFNKFQTKHSVHKLFASIGFFSLIIFSLCNAMIVSGHKFWAYPLYVWKEVYIVILVHIVLGYMNTILTYETAKIVYGPLGAIASIGSILGGQATVYLTKKMTIVTGLENLIAVSMLGVLIVILGAAFFYEKREYVIQDQNIKHKDDSPLKSIVEVKYYVFGIATLVLLTQFVINLANFKFNLEFEKFVFGEVDKAAYLGNLYSIISIVSFALQIVIIPILFKMVKNSRIHFSVPIIYMVFFLFSLIGGTNGLLPVASMFVLYKGFDYSLFSAAKEMLYFPLDAKQKYGAKYLIDMVVYRFSKGLISFILIFVQSMVFIDSLLAICLILWLLILIPLFKLQRKLIKV
ncbi:TLC ATP/ADP transporter [Bacteriovorax sp. BSW11_IV]|uniref:Npt1/Npt2 family nucleotide transporter n=1 Tax=Bacteriovorax sp. BSW11_IV TaxID=1353529 RepID=UPI000389F2B6|nr:Npt1/Npt2 family nucleotide transporter [Bacteriovorax sp. BSW11_IV]EQC49561.1 TLC ATP/ADP transporter [Bacteriovorax sp. BSW11_IV]